MVRLAPLSLAAVSLHGALAQLGSTTAKTEVVKPIDKLQLDARSPMVRWVGDPEGKETINATGTWSAVKCKVDGCSGPDCPSSDFCRAAVAGTEATLEFNFTGSAITIYGNTWQDMSMGAVVNLPDMGDVTVTINGEEKPPSKLSNTGGQLAKVDLNGQVNQTNIKFKFKPQGFMTVNMIDIVLPTAQLDGKE
ncbi:hypothetical protein A1Q2_06453 [Trichosporon asahii var. asahii CBS 8904]|uniref:Uncharacterized protein n=1 Tax=Trichosporon asahii var. asahii (strain CBS 8904) TaxID=1220162 RepID=K1WCA7_TRIAC|nr:hypothetical protein A1Q2_06453 [Trichosporon asahii var. asahii CBS 8904]